MTKLIAAFLNLNIDHRTTMASLNISTVLCFMISEVLEFLRSFQLQQHLLVVGRKKFVFDFVRSRQIQQFLNASEYCPFFSVLQVPICFIF